MDEDHPNYKDVLDPTFWPEYEERMETYFWPQLRHLNANLHILNKIMAFPFDLFVGKREEMPFFDVAITNFLEMSILICTRLLSDSESTGTYKLDSFMGHLVKAVKDEYKPSLTARLAKIDVKAMRTFVRNTLKPIRDDYIAHADRNKFGIISDKDQRILISYLMRLHGRINELFDVLSFNTDYIKLHPQYDPSQMNRGTSDIEQILDHIARDSYVLNMPERVAVFWPERRTKFRQKDIDIINSYRVKFGLKSV